MLLRCRACEHLNHRFNTWAQRNTMNTNHPISQLHHHPINQISHYYFSELNLRQAVSINFQNSKKQTTLSSMESDESKLYHKNTEQLINGMMSFLDEPTERYQNEENENSKNPLCVGVKSIIGMFPAPPPPRLPFQNLNTSFRSHREEQNTFSSNSKMKKSNFEKVCRYKDPYMHEVNRLMFCSTMGHPPNGSPEHFQAAENYALYGKEFLDFPTDIKFPKPMDVSCGFGEILSQPPTTFPKSNPYQGFALQTSGKHPNTTSGPQMLPVMMNHANYWGYPFYQTPNLVQPMMYSNPFLMTQYLNMFVRETQINTSIVQQNQFLTGGIHERLVYAQMLQQQVQTNQAAQSSFSGSGAVGVGKLKLKLQDVKKSDVNQTSDVKFIGNNLCENNLDLDD